MSSAQCGHGVRPCDRAAASISVCRGRAAARMNTPRTPSRLPTRNPPAGLPPLRAQMVIPAYPPALQLPAEPRGSECSRMFADLVLRVSQDASYLAAEVDVAGV